MAEISNSKTWNKVRVTYTGSGTEDAHRGLLVVVKDAMKTYCGWSHVSSCDKTSVSTNPSNDLWTGSSSVFDAVSGSAHSWIVLQNDNLTTGFQICLDVCIADTYSRKMEVWVSTAGFSGGSTTNRPTATDELQLTLPTDYWISSAFSSGTARAANIFYSSDGECAHIFLSNTTAVGGLWIFDKPKNSPTWLTEKVICMVCSGSCIHTEHDTTAETYLATFKDNNKIALGLGTLYIGSTRALTSSTTANASGDYGGNWPCTPMWLLSQNASYPGIIGTVYDLWWTHSTTLVTGDCFPAAPSGTRSQVIIGNMVQGNDGSVFVL